MIGPGGTICQQGLKYKTNNKTYRSKRRLKRSNGISVAFESPEGLKQVPGELAFHFAWYYLDSTDKVNLCLAAPVMSNYAKLRWKSSHLTKWEVKSILAPLNHHLKKTEICEKRIRSVSKLLLLSDFDMGKCIRLLQGSYTGDFLDFPTIDEILHKLLNIPIQDGQPKHDFDLLHKIYHDGAPSSG